jgi:hypothetical protein
VTENRWERYGAAAGVAFAVLVMASFFMVPSPPHVDAGTAKIASYYADHRQALLASGLVGIFGAMFFIWFLGHLRHVLQRAEGGAEALSPIVYGAGIVGVSVGVLSAVPSTVLAFAAHQGDLVANAGVVRMLSDMSAVMTSLLLVVIAVFVAAAGLAMVWGEIVAPALGWIGIGVAVVDVVAGSAGLFQSTYNAFWTGFGVVAFVGFAVWTLAIGGAMLQHPEVERVSLREALFVH